MNTTTRILEIIVLFSTSILMLICTLVGGGWLFATYVHTSFIGGAILTLIIFISLMTLVIALDIHD